MTYSLDRLIFGFLVLALVANPVQVAFEFDLTQHDHAVPPDFQLVAIQPADVTDHHANKDSQSNKQEHCASHISLSCSNHFNLSIPQISSAFDNSALVTSILKIKINKLSLVTRYPELITPPPKA